MGKVVSTNVLQEYGSAFILFLKCITMGNFFLEPWTNIAKQGSERRHKNGTVDNKL